MDEMPHAGIHGDFAVFLVVANAEKYRPRTRWPHRAQFANLGTR